METEQPSIAGPARFAELLGASWDESHPLRTHGFCECFILEGMDSLDNQGTIMGIFCGEIIIFIRYK